MGRKVVVTLFLVAFAFAMYVYLSRDSATLRENMEKASSRRARVIMEDFVLYKYDGGALNAKIKARQGQLFEPNLLELDGDVRLERMIESGRESLASESVTAILASSSLQSMIGADAGIERAELEQFVEVGFEDNLLTTDYAEYIPHLNRIETDRPVRVQGPQRVFNSSDGFIYNLKEETLELRGTVRGSVEREEAPL